MQSAPTAPATDETVLDDEPSSDTLIEDELVFEEISIDGMCGVY